MKKIVFTIVHSTRILKELIHIFKHYKIKILVNVRYFPKNKYNPQFNKETLKKELPKYKIIYS